MSTTAARRLGIVALAAVLGALGLASGARAGEFYEKHGAAIQGYDPVAYLTEMKPVKGSAQLTSDYLGSTFHFASAANRDAFEADPERYVPQYGGFCAYGTAVGYKAKTEPDAFTIVEGKLYLNYDLSVRKRWSRDIPGHIAQADRNWPEVRKSTKVHQ